MARSLQYSCLPRAPRVSQDSVGSTLGFSLSREGVTMIETDTTVPVAEIIVLERIEAGAAADYERLQTAVVGQVVSTGPLFGREKGEGGQRKSWCPAEAPTRGVPR